MTEILVLAFATFAILRAWFLGDIFEDRRARYESQDGWLSRLLSCPLCLSYHVALLLVVLFVLPQKIYNQDWWGVIFLPVQWLATVGVVHCMCKFVPCCKQE